MSRLISTNRIKNTTTLVVLLIGFVAAPLKAATVNTVSCDVPESGVADLCVTGVDGVVINGTIYNVEFVFDSFTNLNVGDNFPFYPTYGGPGDASVAVDAINLAINTSGTGAERILAAGSTTASLLYEVVKQPSAGPFQNTSRGIISDPFGGSMFVNTNGVVSNDGAAHHAVFTVVPVPAAVWLFGSALVGLGWLRREQTV